jgi:EAL domain-containing protein (putative c-di-GMP-specific phosphodiesterase class I)/CRISPR/Cas system-associated exonuclease Cas4 (RecB family)
MIEEIIKYELIEIHFQPIVSIRSKKLYAFEALTRCTYKGEVIPPYELFKLAIDSNLNLELDILTRNKSIEKFKNYYLENNELILFLNFESSLINNFDREEKNYSFTEVIDNVGIPYKNFIIEIKEDEISNTKALEAFCVYYKELGFSIALDDFGTGNSTFDRINIIKPDLIKIDKSLFKNTKNNHINKEIVKAIARMSHNLGIRVLAEGVEDEASIFLAMKSNINLFQGYYFSRPVYELDTFLIDKIIVTIVEIGSIFRRITIDSINKKRDLVDKYHLFSNKIIEQIIQINNAKEIIEKELNNYIDLEAIYLIDAESSRQVHDTVINNKNDKFIPSKHGDEHYLKEYYYITLESKKGIYLSNKYISYATGNICKTFARKFDINGEFYIICLDIIIKRN